MGTMGSTMASEELALIAFLFSRNPRSEIKATKRTRSVPSPLRWRTTSVTWLQ
jgi:hypothetical protein